MRILTIAITAVLVMTAQADAAEINVLSGNGGRAAVRELCAQFGRASGHKVTIHFEVNAALRRKIEAGEPFDVAVLNPPPLDELIKLGKIDAATRVDIGRAGLGVGVRSGTAKPDVSSLDAFKRALLAAHKGVAYPGEGASGIYFASLV